MSKRGSADSKSIAAVLPDQNGEELQAIKEDNIDVEMKADCDAILEDRRTDPTRQLAINRDSQSSTRRLREKVRRNYKDLLDGDDTIRKTIEDE